MVSFSLTHSEILVLAALPFTGALMGWLTNLLAIRMLFRPRRAISFLGCTVQGLVPKRQKELAEKIGETIEQKLISHRDVQELLQSEETQKKIEHLINQQVDVFLSEKLRVFPMAQMFLQGDLAIQIKGLLVSQFSSAIPSFVDGLIEQIEGKLHFKDVVQKKIQSFDLAALEELVYDIASKELRTIELLGGFLGFLVGLLQVALLLAVR